MSKAVKVLREQWECSGCKQNFWVKEQAGKCCQTFECSDCGKTTKKIDWLKRERCSSCHEDHLLATAEKSELKECEMIYHNGSYYHDPEDLIDSEMSDLDPAIIQYVWIAEGTEFKPSVEDWIADHFYEHCDGVDERHMGGPLEHMSELVEFFDKWLEKEGVLPIYYPGQRVLDMAPYYDREELEELDIDIPDWLDEYWKSLT